MCGGYRFDRTTLELFDPLHIVQEAISLLPGSCRRPFADICYYTSRLIELMNGDIFIPKVERERIGMTERLSVCMH